MSRKIINPSTAITMSQQGITVRRNRMNKLLREAISSIPNIDSYLGSGDVKKVSKEITDFLSKNPIKAISALSHIETMPEDFQMFEDGQLVDKATYDALVEDRDVLKKRNTLLEKEYNDLLMDEEAEMDFDAIRKSASKLLSKTIREGNIANFAKITEVMDKMEGLFHNKANEEKPTDIHVHVVNYGDIDFETIDEHGSGEVQQYSMPRGVEWMKIAWDFFRVKTEEERIQFCKERGVIAIQDNNI